jgi:TPR repeat protein
MIGRLLIVISLFALVGSVDGLARSPRENKQVVAVQRLADRGHARAQTRLGYMFATGQGVPQNYATAVYWYRRASEQGDPDGQYLLGDCLNLAKGTPLDLVEAYMWMDISASRTADPNERDHRVRMRDAIASKLSRQALALAQDRALAWQLKPER